MFHLICVLIIFGSAWVAEWPPFGNKLVTRLAICSLCILLICNLSCFPSWFKGWIWVLIVSVPGLCILITFRIAVLVIY